MMAGPDCYSISNSKVCVRPESKEKKYSKHQRTGGKNGEKKDRYGYAYAHITRQLYT